MPGGTILLFIVVFPKVKPLITYYYNNFQSNYGLIYNVKMLLCHILLLPVTESDPLDYSLFSLENSSTSNDVNFSGIPCCAVSVGSLVNSQVSGSPSSLHVSHSAVSPEVSIGVPVCNRFASLNMLPLLSCLLLVMRKQRRRKVKADQSTVQII